MGFRAALPDDVATSKLLRDLSPKRVYMQNVAHHRTEVPPLFRGGKQLPSLRPAQTPPPDSEGAQASKPYLLQQVEVRRATCKDRIGVHQSHCTHRAFVGTRTQARTSHRRAGAVPGLQWAALACMLPHLLRPCRRSFWTRSFRRVRSVRPRTAHCARAGLPPRCALMRTGRSLRRWSIQ